MTLTPAAYLAARHPACRIAPTTYYVLHSSILGWQMDSDGVRGGIWNATPSPYAPVKRYPNRTTAEMAQDIFTNSTKWCGEGAIVAGVVTIHQITV